MKIKILSTFVILLVIAACTPNEEPPPSETKGVPGTQVLLHYFPERGLQTTDTSSFFINNEAEFEESQALNMLLKRILPDSVFENVVFGVEEHPKHKPAYRFPLDNRYDACLLSSKEHWYFQTSMLIYDKQTGYFTDMEVLAQFYGGDGGQIATESWLWDDGLYRKESFRSVRFNPDIDDAEESVGEVSALYSWKNGAFEPAVMTDSLALSKQFPMNWEW